MIDVLFYCTEPDTTPVNEVVVRIFDSNGDFVTQATSGAVEDGEALLTVPDVGDYTARFSMAGSGYSIESPLAFSVVEDEPGSTVNNTFEVSVNLFTLPQAVDPNFCRCSGYFRTPAGAPSQGLKVRIQNLARPVLLGRDAIGGGTIDVNSDSAGYAQVDLIRQGIYRATLPDFPDAEIEFEVPNLAGANLPDVLYPYVVGIIFDPSSLELEEDGTATVAVEILYRSGLRKDIIGLETLPVSFSSSDEAIAIVQVTDTGLVVTAAGPGVASITATRGVVADLGVVILPDPGDVTGSLEVTVS